MDILCIWWYRIECISNIQNLLLLLLRISLKKKKKKKKEKKKIVGFFLIFLFCFVLLLDGDGSDDNKTSASPTKSAASRGFHFILHFFRSYRDWSWCLISPPQDGVGNRAENNRSGKQFKKNNNMELVEREIRSFTSGLLSKYIPFGNWFRFGTGCFNFSRFINDRFGRGGGTLTEGETIPASSRHFNGSLGRRSLRGSSDTSSSSAAGGWRSLIAWREATRRRRRSSVKWNKLFYYL